MGLKVGVRSCKELRKAKVIEWRGKGLSAADLATLGKLTPVLPALETLRLSTRPDSGPDGGQRLVEGLGVGMLPAVTWFELWDVCVGDAGASALSAALDRGSAAARAPRSAQGRHRRRGSGGPRAGLAAAARAEGAW